MQSKEANPGLEELLEIWTQVFTQPPSVFDGMWNSFPPGGRRTFFQREEGRLVSTVQVYLLPMRSEDGLPEVVGGIANVATLPSHRRQGRSEALLREAITWMEERDVDWSYLFTGIPEHYARLGWKLMPERVGKVEVTATVTPVAPIEAPDDKALARAYAETTEHTPLAHIRTPQVWSSLILPRLAQRLVWQEDDAYVVANMRDEGMHFVECGGSPKKVSRLILAAISHSGNGSATFHLPEVDSLEEPLAQMGGVVSTHIRSSYSMARPVRQDPNLDALARGWFSELDHF